MRFRNFVVALLLVSATLPHGARAQTGPALFPFPAPPVGVVSGISPGSDLSPGSVLATGAVQPATLAAKSALTMTFEELGLVGDGVTTNDAAWNTAVASGAYAGKSLNLIPASPNRDYYFAGTMAAAPGWALDGRVPAVGGLTVGSSWHAGSAYAQGRFYGTVLPSAGNTWQFGAATCSIGVPTSGSYVGGTMPTTSGSFVTFVSSVTATGDGSSGNPYQVAIGPDFPTFIANLKAFFTSATALADPNLSRLTYKYGNHTAAQMSGPTSARWELEFEYTSPGTAGNAYAYGVATGNTNQTISGPFGLVAGKAILTSGTYIFSGGTNHVCGRLAGGGAPVQGTTFSSGSATAAMALGQFQSLQNLYVVSALPHSMPLMPFYLQTQIASMFSGGVRCIVASTTDVVLDNIGVMGCKTGTYGNGLSRMRMTNSRLDAWNGIEYLNSFDTNAFEETFANNYWKGSYSNVYFTNYRGGKFFAAHDGSSGINLKHLFCYGCAIKYDVWNELNASFTNTSADGVNGGGPSSSWGSAGVLDIQVTAGGANYVSPVVTLSTSNGETLTTYKSSGVITDIDTLDTGNWSGMLPGSDTFPVTAPAAPTVTITDGYAGGSDVVGTAQGTPSTTLVATSTTLPAFAGISASCLTAGTTIRAVSGATLTIAPISATACAAGTALTLTGGSGASATAVVQGAIAYRTHGTMTSVALNGAGVTLGSIGLQLKATAGTHLLNNFGASGEVVNELVAGPGTTGVVSGGSFGNGFNGVNQFSFSPTIQGWQMAGVAMGCDGNGGNPPIAIPQAGLSLLIASNLQPNPNAACGHDPVTDAANNRITTGLTATGTNAATALVLNGGTSVFSTVASGTGAILPPAAANENTVVANFGASALSLYPLAGNRINALATGAAFSVPAGAVIAVSCGGSTTCLAK